MVNPGTSTAASIPPPANEVALETTASAAPRELRRQRIHWLREAIENGQYSVSAGDLADALLRSGREAN